MQPEEVSSGHESDGESGPPISPPVHIIMNTQVTKRRMQMIHSIIELADEDPITAITLLEAQGLTKIKKYLQQFEPTWNINIRPEVRFECCGHQSY